MTPKEQRVEVLEGLLREVLELYPQSYRCVPGGCEYAHMESQDWKDVRTKIEAALCCEQSALDCVSGAMNSTGE